MPSLYEHAGGETALHRLEQTFYDSVLKDPLLQPLFGEGQPQHVDHLTAFTAESFGGPDRFSIKLTCPPVSESIGDSRRGSDNH